MLQADNDTERHVRRGTPLRMCCGDVFVFSDVQHSCVMLCTFTFASIAREVLDSETHDATTLSLRTLFYPEFQAAAVAGCLPRALYLVLHMLDVLLDHSVQVIEGCNNLIKLAGTRSPNISLELLSARIGLKKAT